MGHIDYTTGKGIAYIYIYDVKDISTYRFRFVCSNYWTLNCISFTHVNKCIYTIILDYDRSSFVSPVVETVVLDDTLGKINVNTQEMQQCCKKITSSRYMIGMIDRDCNLCIYSCLHAPFKPSSFHMHSHDIQQLAVRVFMLAKKLETERHELPTLPTEIWLLIINMFPVYK